MLNFHFFLCVCVCALCNHFAAGLLLDNELHSGSSGRTSSTCTM